ncbi:MAG: terminase TerL endonuclease subunit [Rhodospirillaceae bacterium]
MTPAETAAAFLSRLKVTEGARAGRAFALQPWQREIVDKLYAVGDDGRRLVRTSCVWLPRGNGKTTLAAGLGLLHTFGPMADAAGQVVVAAADRGQAGIAYQHAKRFVEFDPYLTKICRVTDSNKTIWHDKSGSTFKAISAEAYSKHGMNVSLLIADEIHCWPVGEGRDLWKTLTQSMGKRDQPLIISISTAGEGMHSLAWDMWDYSLKVSRGEIIDPTFLPIIFAADPQDDWRSEEVWRKANPALASGFRSLEEMRNEARRCDHFPADQEAFRRYYLNVWSDGAASPWIDLTLYDEAGEPIDETELLGRRCYLGVDLSSTQDLTAIVAVFPDDDGGYSVLCRFFVPAENIKRRADKDKVQYPLWRDQGHLTATPGNVVDYDFVCAEILDMHERFDVAEVVIDRWNSSAVTSRLAESGIEVAQFGQGFASMAPALRELERAILAKQFRHGGNPILRWNFMNVVIEQDAAANQKFTKAKAAEKIDGAVAAAMAIGRAVANEAGPSPYTEDRGFLFI